MSDEVKIRRVSVEFLRPGRSHNQLLSPYTQYLAVCNDAGAGVVAVPYEHRVFERRLKELRYETGDQTDRLDKTLKVKSSDTWWKQTIDLLMYSSHLIVVDLSWVKAIPARAQFSPNARALDYSPVRQYGSRQRKREFKFPIDHAPVRRRVASRQTTAYFLEGPIIPFPRLQVAELDAFFPSASAPTRPTF